MTVDGVIEPISYWYPGLLYWNYLGLAPPQVVIDTQFYLAANWLNTGAVRAKGHIDVEITKPGGQKAVLTGIGGQDTEIDPGAACVITFSPTILDQIGNYQGQFILKMEEVGEPPPDGEYYDHALFAGWNNVGYLGKTLPCAECFESIMSYLIIAWYYIGLEPTYYYDPNDPGSTLHTIENGGAYWIRVTQGCTWRYPLP